MSNDFGFTTSLFTGSDRDLDGLAIQTGNLARMDLTSPKDDDGWRTDAALKFLEGQLMRSDLERYAELMLRAGVTAEISFDDKPDETSAKLGGMMVLIQHVNALRRIQGAGFNPDACKTKLDKLISFAQSAEGARGERVRSLLEYHRGELARRTGDYKTMAEVHDGAATATRDNGDTQSMLISQLKYHVALVNEAIAMLLKTRTNRLHNMLEFCRNEAMAIEDPAWQFHRITHMFLAAYWCGVKLADAAELKAHLRTLETIHTQIAEQQGHWVRLIYAISDYWEHEEDQWHMARSLTVEVMAMQKQPESTATAILLNLDLEPKEAANTGDAKDALETILSDEIQGAHQVKAIAHQRLQALAA